MADQPHDQPAEEHGHGPSWLEENEWAVKVLYVAFGFSLVLGIPYASHGHYWWEVYVFHGFYGFCSYVGLVLLAVQLRKLLMAPEDFYGE